MQRTAIIVAYFFASVYCYSQTTGSDDFKRSDRLTQATGQYPFVHYTPKDGLVNSRVKKTYQDSKGRMYFLTAGGLSIYDGARFRNYTTQNGLPTDIINDVLEVGDDSLLLAVNTGKLIALVNGKVEELKTGGDPCPTINQFYRASQQKI